RVRGVTTVGWRAPKFRVRMNEGYEFVYRKGEPPAKTFSLDSSFIDPSCSRLILAFELFREAGAYASIAEPIHTRMNGEFYRYSVFLEKIGSSFLRRNGLGRDSLVYKAAGIMRGAFLEPVANFETTRGMEQNSRRWKDGKEELREIIQGLELKGREREQFLYENVDLPEVMSALAVYAITKHFDSACHNYFTVRDSQTGLWSLIPWDLDLVWERMTEPLFGRTFTGHPFMGGEEYFSWTFYHWNRLYDAIYTTPTIRDMYLRRVRTLMDEYLQPAETPAEKRYLEGRANELRQRIEKVAAADYAESNFYKGGPLGNFGAYPEGLPQLMKSFQRRREYLYSIVILPDAQPKDAKIEVAKVVLPKGNQPGHVELTNANDYAVDVSGWKLEGAAVHTLQKGTVIPAKGKIFVTKNAREFWAAELSGLRGYAQGGAKFPDGAGAAVRVRRVAVSK
ncbi:MAG: CotH kinase family protein, partial [Planctomycetota bacterium]